jgi:hypothetical protein
MFDIQLFLPVLAQVALTAALSVPTAAGRWSAAMKREVNPKDIALGQRNWPKRVQQISNAFNNQWESPTLFYAGVGFAMIAGAGGALLVGLAWAYVASRAGHALVYVTSNFIPLRFLVFIIGFLALLAFWVVLGARALAA